MSSWIMKLLGVIVATAISEMLLPDKQLKRITRTVFALCCIFTVLEPLTLLNGDSLTSNLTVGGSSAVNYTETALSMRRSVIEKSVMNKLISEGFEVDGVTVELNSEGDLQSVDIFLKNEILSDGDGHINRLSEITELVREYLNVPAEVINVS